MQGEKASVFARYLGAVRTGRLWLMVLGWRKPQKAKPFLLPEADQPEKRAGPPKPD